MSTFRHERGLPDTTPCLATAGIRKVTLHVQDVIEDALIMMVHGPNGAGKTSSIDWALRQHAVAGQTPICEVAVTHTPTSKSLLVDISNALGLGVPSRATRDDLIHRVIGELQREPWIVWLDEVENASAGSLKVIRHIFDHKVRCPVVLSGDQNLRRHLQRHEPGLLSRVGRTVLIEAIPDDAAPALLAGYDPVFAATSAGMIRNINQRLRGSFRAWAQLTQLIHSMQRQTVEPIVQVTPEIWDLARTALDVR